MKNSYVTSIMLVLCCYLVPACGEKQAEQPSPADKKADAPQKPAQPSPAGEKADMPQPESQNDEKNQHTEQEKIDADLKAKIEKLREEERAKLKKIAENLETELAKNKQEDEKRQKELADELARHPKDLTEKLDQIQKDHAEKNAAASKEIEAKNKQKQEALEKTHNDTLLSKFDRESKHLNVKEPGDDGKAVIIFQHFGVDNQPKELSFTQQEFTEFLTNLEKKVIAEPKTQFAMLLPNAFLIDNYFLDVFLRLQLGMINNCICTGDLLITISKIV